MKLHMMRFAGVCCFAATGLIYLGCVDDRPRRVVRVERDDRPVVVERAPAPVIVEQAPPRREVIVVEPPPPERYEREPVHRPGVIWIRGHYIHDGRHYVWVPGHEERIPHERAEWIPGHWDHVRGGYIWVEGQWR